MSHHHDLPQRLIFTVTTGRSGTNYLAEILACLPHCAVDHEPAPFFHDWMRRVQREPGLATGFLRDQKLPAIAGCGRPVYIETSHLFCKGFFEPLLELGQVPDLILLSRPHRSVAASLYGLGTIPGRGGRGEGFYLSPADPVLLPLPGWEGLHEYQLCYWYCLEIERRQRQYAEQVRTLGGRAVAVSLDELSTLAGIERLIAELDLPGPGLIGGLRLRWRLGRKVNDKSHKKKRSLPVAEMERLERELLAILAGTYP